ncbi:ImmA/IrrE family metallo-endopeptidase [Bradyrhizobium sp. SBR1B]|uniref:ImmA/IrrE family metallo-endopeptidase n=1 Tax=Bradyrhizobium sp. SBR1B TaxID=2663836 RepID=UPI001606812E|nr:ImmA/IrrE family metallo-endopeptidase [Bradyrhizobium sp. SBR1B]MBB4383266.1 Zn-dependent peptidase ImmA (M78 family) [Bradyrhizobium sp. SBR1B]
MAVSRIDLADVGSPERLVIEIFKAEPDLPIPIPVEKLAIQLGIEEIKELESDGFIGGLITNETKSRGVVLVQRRMKAERRRFTIGHELGHFLIPAHRPGKEDRFLCSMSDLLELDPKIADMRRRWEAEANRFSSLLLVPPHHFRKEANSSRDPDLGEVVRLAERYEVSKEVLGRAYVDYREEPVAFVVTHNGRVLRYFYRKGSFPFISVRWGDPVPKASLLIRKNHEQSVTSEIEETDAAQWLDVSRGHRAPTLFEQVHRQQQGYALILLSVEPSEEDDEADDSNWNRR